MRKSILPLILLLLLCGCIATGFDSYYSRLNDLYKKYQLNGAVAPIEMTALQRYEQDLKAFKKELEQKNDRDAKAMKLLIDIKLNLAEVQKNLAYARQRLRVYSEFVSCGAEMKAAHSAVKDALSNIETASSKYKLFEDSFPEAAKKVKANEGDLGRLIKDQLGVLEKVDQQLKEICG